MFRADGTKPYLFPKEFSYLWHKLIFIIEFMHSYRRDASLSATMIYSYGIVSENPCKGIMSHYRVHETHTVALVENICQQSTNFQQGAA